MSSLLYTRTSIPLSLANEAMKAAPSQAEADQVKVSVAILDAAGNMLHMVHMDGAPGLSREIARRKAATAVAFSVSTTAWEERFQHCLPAVRQGLPLQEGIALIGGGEPFLAGLRGRWHWRIRRASEQLDARCAEAAVRRVEGLLAGEWNYGGAVSQGLGSLGQDLNPWLSSK